MFSSEYIENVSERINMYRELDNLENENELNAFQLQLEDRFGKLPQQATDLMLIVRLRWNAMRFGVEKLVLKNGQMIAYLVSNLKSTYYQSDEFGRLLQYMARNPRICRLREQNGKRSVIFTDINNIQKAFHIFEGI